VKWLIIYGAAALTFTVAYVAFDLLRYRDEVDE